MLQNVWKVIENMFKDIFLKPSDEIPRDPVRLLYEFYPNVEFSKVPNSDEKIKTYCVQVTLFHNSIVIYRVIEK